MKHMKKFFAVLVLAVAAIALVACGGDSKSEYKHDGVFRAFTANSSQKAPQIVWVEVTIENGEIAGYNLDTIQSGLVIKENKEGDEKAVVAWNEKTKKELKEDYGMAGKPYSPKYELQDGEWIEVEGENCELEWYEQAELIEKAWLERGVEEASTTTLDNEEEPRPRFDSIAGVTIADDDYKETALKALENAKEGKFLEFKWNDNDGAPQIVWVTKTLDENNALKEMEIDTLQSETSITEEEKEGEVQKVANFKWNPKSKQELKDEYGMAGKPYSPKYELQDGEWVKVEGKNCELEWYEQANLITDYIVENGYTKKLVTIGVDEEGNERGVALDGEDAPIEVLAGVTIKTADYLDLINKLFE